MSDLGGPFATILVARRLDSRSSGSTVYLAHFMDLLISAGLRPRLVVDERRGFGNRPWVWLDSKFVAKSSSIEFGYALRVGRLSISLKISNWTRAIKRALSLTPKRSAAVPSDLGVELNPADCLVLAERANELDSSIVIAEYSSIAPCLAHCRAPHKAVFTHDFFSLRASSFLEHGKDPDHAVITFDEEIRRISPATVIFHASQHELQAASNVLEKKAHFWIRPGVRSRPKMTSDGESPVAVFLGVKHGGNLDAVKTLLETIWPLVRAEIPDAQLWIVGEISTVVPAKYRDGFGIVCKDHVKSLDSLSGPSFIGLAPTRIASGISIKVIEYLRLGMPTVALPEALQGFGDALNGLVLEAADETAFARELVDLFQGHEKRMEFSHNGISGVEDRMRNDDVVDYLRALKNIS